MSWPEYFLGIAEQVKLKSKDWHTQIGAVVVGPNNEIVSTGYNSFPRGIDDEQDYRQERPEKYYWFEHAERAALYNAALIGASTKGCTMYITSQLPCADCARGIINSGIQKVFCRTEIVTKGDLWEESCKRSLQMFKEAGVEVNFYE